jgi:hypothetical protein
MNALPTNIDVAAARLPATYEQAKVALASCERLDECQDWANKAEALASYAKMADDDTLRALADRIQARAIRRMGELLKEFDARPANASKQSGGAPTLISQKDAAAAAGLSKDQTVQAVRVANVPAEQFEAVIESKKPPTVTALAELGKQSRPVPEGFKQATHLIGAVKRFAEFCQDNDAGLVAGGVLPAEAGALRSMVGVIDGWLDRFIINLKG